MWGNVSRMAAEAGLDVHRHLSGSAKSTFRHAVSYLTMFPPDAAWSNRGKLSDIFGPTLTDSKLESVRFHHGSGDPPAPKMFWEKKPTRESLVQQVRELAKQPPMQVNAPALEQREEAKRAYEPVFEALADHGTGSLDLTTTERFLIDSTHRALYGRPLPGTMIQASGLFDRALIDKRLGEANAYVDKATQHLGGDTRLKELNAEQWKDLAGKLGASAASALGCSTEVDISCVLTGHLHGSDAMAVVYRGQQPMQVLLLPPLLRSDPLTLLGSVLQEYVHVAQDELVQATEAAAETPRLTPTDVALGRMLSVSWQRAIRGKLDYPMTLEHERDGWMTELAAKIIASHHPAFATCGSPATLYRHISLETLHADGPERLLGNHVAGRCGFDPAQLAMSIGVREGTASPVKPQPFLAMSQYLEETLGPGNVPGSKKARAEVRADLLASMSDVVDAMQDKDHPYQGDAEMLVMALHEALGFPSSIVVSDAEATRVLKPFGRGEADSAEAIEAACKRIAPQLKTPLGREMLVELAMAERKSTDPDERARLRQAARLDPP